MEFYGQHIGIITESNSYRRLIKFVVLKRLHPIGESGFDNDELILIHEKMGRYHRVQGKNFSKTWEDYLEAIYHFRLAGNHSDADELAEDVAKFYYTISNFAETNRLTGEIVERENPPVPWWALNWYGMCQLTLGFPDRALNSFERALRVSPTKKEEGATLNSISQIFQACGDYDTALKHLEQSLKIIQEIGDKEIEGTTLNNISGIFQARGDYDTALKYLEQSLKIRQEIGDRSGMSETLYNMGHIAFQDDDLEKAMTLWSETLSIAMEIKYARVLFHVAGQMGSIYAKMDNKEEARKHLSLAVQVGKQAGFPNVNEFEEILKKV